jgi:hypothetical protein
MKPRMGEIKHCKVCTTEFYVPQYRIKTAKFCSLDCQNHKQYEKHRFSCNGCGKVVITSPSRRNYNKRFCSLECRESRRKTDVERRKATKAYNISKRGNMQGRSFRKHVFVLKEKKCMICGYDEYDFCLDLHHIDKDCTNNKIENIAILCAMCHRKLHKGLINL